MLSQSVLPVGRQREWNYAFNVEGGGRHPPFFKTSVETENNKLAGKLVELPSGITMELTKSHSWCCSQVDALIEEKKKNQKQRWGPGRASPGSRSNNSPNPPFHEGL